MQFLKQKFTDIFSSLRYRNFRLFAFGQLISLSGSWVQGIALSWVAYEITNSPTTLGVVTALSFGPVLLFGFLGGFLVDRLPKFKIIVLTHVLYSLTPFFVAYHLYLGDANIYFLYAAALATGLLRIIDSPARQAFRYALIPESETKNAISIFSTTNSFSRIMGPLLAGVLLTGLGPAWCFFVNGLSFWVVIAMLLAMRTEDLFVKENKKDLNTFSLWESLMHIWKDKILRQSLLLATVLSILFLNTQVMLPIFTREIFNMGVMSFTSLVAIYSVGCILLLFYSPLSSVR
jgi:MFS family permease